MNNLFSQLWSISPINWRKARSLVQSISLTKLHPTLAINTTSSYSKLLCFMLYVVHQKDQCKPTGRKAAPRILIKLTSGVDFTNTLQAAFGQFHQHFMSSFCANGEYSIF